MAIVGLHKYAEKRKTAIKYQGGDSLSLVGLTEKYIANSAKRVAKLWLHNAVPAVLERDVPNQNTEETKNAFFTFKKRLANLNKISSVIIDVSDAITI